MPIHMSTCSSHLANDDLHRTWRADMDRTGRSRADVHHAAAESSQLHGLIARPRTDARAASRSRADVIRTWADVDRTRAAVDRSPTDMELWMELQTDVRALEDIDVSALAVPSSMSNGNKPLAAVRQIASVKTNAAMQPAAAARTWPIGRDRPDVVNGRDALIVQRQIQRPSTGRSQQSTSVDYSPHSHLSYAGRQPIWRDTVAAADGAHGRLPDDAAIGISRRPARPLGVADLSTVCRAQHICYHVACY